MQQQIGTSNCGLFAIGFAVETCLKDNVETYFLIYLHGCLESGKITSFPKIDINILSCSIDQRLKINVYCICRKPDFFDNQVL